MSNQLIFTGNLVAHSDYALRNPEYVSILAWHLRAMGLRGTRAYAWIEEQVYACHVGDLFNVKEDWLDPDALRSEQLWTMALLRRSQVLEAWRIARFPSENWGAIKFEMRDLFGEDVKGTMDNFVRFADVPPSRQVDEHLAARVMFIDFAIRIQQGAIAQAGDNSAT